MRRFIYMNDAPVVPPVTPPVTPPATTFTQEQVNKFLAEEKRKDNAARTKLVEELETLRNGLQLSEQQKTDFEASLETLKSQHMTEAQKLAAENDKWKKKHATDTTALGDETKQWRGRFENMMITNAIVSGAVQHKGLRPEQFVDMLSSKAKVVADVDADGKPTGTFSAKLPVKTVDPKSKETVIVDLPIAEAIGKMKGDEGYFNLFEEEGKGGLGGGGNARKKTGNSEFSKNMDKDEFGKWFANEVSS